MPATDDARLDCRPETFYKPVPPILSSLLRRTRASLLVLLVLVLPLQGVVQLVAGMQDHRHVHTGAAPFASRHGDGALSSLTRPLRAVLDHLHASQDARLAGPKFSWIASSGPAAGMHQHGGVFHKHSVDTHDVLDVQDAGDDSLQAGAVVFLAWLPSAPVLMAGQGSEPPAALHVHWRDRLVAPLLAPPRG